MVIKLNFHLNKEPMNFEVIEKEIWFNSRTFKDRIRCIPKDEVFIKKIILSRNRLPPILMEMFNLSEKDKKEYEDACLIGEEALAERIIIDCQERGLILINKEIIK